MKLTKLSLVAALAVSSAFAGGDIAPVEPVVEAPVVEAACNANTTIDGKATGYYWSFENFNGAPTDLFDGDTSNLGAAVTLNVSHKITDNVTANFSAVGFTNLFGDDYPMFENTETGAFLNVANITATYGDTTFILGRQILDTPTVGNFDWLFAPGAYEAYTVSNTSIDNVTLVGSFITKYRVNNGGVDFRPLSGKNWTVGAAYSDAFDASVWYYNIDDGGYTQVYADAGTKFSGIDFAVNYVNTDYDVGPASTGYGIKASGSVAGFDLMAAYVKVEDAAAAYLDNDSMYTTMWNSLGSDEVGDAFKVGAATEISGVAVDVAYAGYSNDDGIPDGHEFDVILGYEITKCIDVAAIYTNTETALTGYMESNTLEFLANYKF